MKSTFTTKQLTVGAVLLALNVILGKYANIGPHQYSVNAGFVAMVYIGYLFNPVKAMIIAVLANIIAFTIIGSQPFSPYFVISAALAGLVYGAFHYNQGIATITIVSVVITIGVSWGLSSYFIALQNHSLYLAELGKRAMKVAIMLPVQLLVTYFLLNHPSVQRFKNYLEH